MTTKARKQKAKAKRRRATKHSRYTVFISHSSKDIFIAEQIVKEIERSGVDCKIDKRDFEGGGNIWDEINKAVRESQEVLILFTSNSKNAEWVSFEVGAASQLKRQIIPILYNVKYEKLKIIAGRIAIELNTGFSKYLTDLTKRVDKWETKGK
ncbi:MAG TPA: toll/interleukin-1 receptor domain-containing protein [Pyrinomonadaceae bacterium]|jgi:hypothetical protein